MPWYTTIRLEKLSRISPLNVFRPPAVLELGKAKPFGQNDLAGFFSTDQMLRAALSGQALPNRQKQDIRQFKVIDSILK